MAVNYTPSLSSGLGPSPVKKSDMQAWLNEISSGIASLDPRATPIYASRASAVSAAPGLPASLTHIMVREGTALVIRSRTASGDDPLFTSGAQWGVVMRQDTATLSNFVDSEISRLDAEIGKVRSQAGSGSTGDVLQTWSGEDLLTRVGKRNWAGSETLGEVSDPLYSRSDLIAVKKGECFRLDMPFEVLTTPRKNYVAFYDSPDQPKGSLVYTNRTDVYVAESAAYLNSIAAIDRRKVQYFCVPRDGFIAVQSEDAIKEDVRLDKVSHEVYLQNHWYEDAEKIFSQMRDLGCAGVTPVIEVMGKTYLTESSTEISNSAKGALSEYIPVKAGQFVHVFTTTFSSVSFSVYDSVKTLVELKTGPKVHDPSVQRNLNSSSGSFAMAENVQIEQDGFIRVLNGTDGLFPADSMWVSITDHFIDYDRGFLKSNPNVRRLANFGITVLNSKTLVLATDSRYDTIGPIHVKKGQILRVLTTDLPEAVSSVYATLHNPASYGDNTDFVQRIPFFGSFFPGSSTPTTKRDSVRFVCADDFDLTVQVVCPKGSGGVQIVSEDEFLRERANIMSKMKPTYKVLAESGAEYGKYKAGNLDAGIGHIPIRAGEVLVYDSNIANSLYSKVLGIPDGITGGIEDSLLGTVNQLGSSPVLRRVARLGASRTGYVGWNVSVANQAEADLFYAESPPFIMTREEYLRWLQSNTVPVEAMSNNSAWQVDWDADGNWVTRKPTRSSSDGATAGYPFFVPKGAFIKYYGNVNAYNGLASFPFAAYGNTQVPLWKGPNRLSAGIPQPVSGYLHAERDMYVVLNKFTTIPRDFEDLGQNAYLTAKQEGMFIQGISDIEYSRNRTIFGGDQITIPNPFGLEFDLIEGLAPSVSSDSRGGSWGLMQIRQAGQIVATLHCLMELQGQSSKANPTIKRNWDLKFYNSANVRVKFKIGDWKETEKLIFKGYDRDLTKARDPISTAIWRSVRRARPYPKNLIWDERLLSQAETFPEIEDYSDAVLSTQGTPTTVMLGGSSLGIYALRNKKDNPNYAMQKNNPNHILMENDYTEGGGLINWGEFGWHQWEVRHPKLSGYEPGAVPVDEVFKGKVERFFKWIANCLAGSVNFSSTKDDYINVESFIDTFIVNELLKHTDGLRNNILLATWDGLHWTATIYDCDMTFKDSFTSLISDKIGPWKLLWENMKPEIKARYAELREAGVISNEAMFEHFSGWTKAIPDSWKQTERDFYPTQVYPGHGPLYMMDWVKERIFYLDTAFEYLP